MSLRKSPRRTRALLAANRTNCRKSTGPRTPIGKRRSSWNAVRHGCRMRAGAYCIPFAAREAEAFQVFYFTLRDAIQPTAGNVAGERALLLTAVRAWRIKGLFERLTRSLNDEDWQALATGTVPPPDFWRLRIKRPGLSVPDWTVTISVWLRWSRGPGQGGGRSRPLASDDGPQRHRPRMHTMLSVHSSGPSRPAEALEAEPRGPECDTMQSASENMPVPGDRESGFAAVYALAQGLLRSLMGGRQRTKPEYNRKETSFENMSAPDGGKIAPAILDQSESQASPEVSGGTKQTKPECFRKEGAYKNILKTLGWLGAAASFLLKRGRGWQSKRLESSPSP